MSNFSYGLGALMIFLTMESPTKDTAGTSIARQSHGSLSANSMKR